MKKLSGIIIVSIVVLVFFSSFAADLSAKGTKSAAYLYTLPNYLGKKYEVTGDVSSLPSQKFMTGDVIFNDKISSIRLVRISSVTVFVNSYFQGTCETFTQNVPNLSRTSVGNNTISSVKINSRCPGRVPSVTLYDQKDFKGRSVTINETIGDLGVSNFRNKTASLALNNVSSIAVFNKSHFQGNCQTFTHNYRSLAGTKIGLNSIVSVKFNTKCIDQKKLTIRNRSGLLIQVFFPGGRTPQGWREPTKGKKKIASGQHKIYYINPEKQIQFSIKALQPIGDLAPLPMWDQVCTFDFLMGHDYIITAKGSFFKAMNCQKEIDR